MVSTPHRMIQLVGRWVCALCESPQLLALSLLAMVLLAETAMAGESRVALVIGNRDYRTGSLTNAINDSRAMRELLIRHGFQVVYRENLKSNEIGSTLQEFKNTLGQGAVALFYYSGHGSQFRGVNYLHSVNDESTNEFELAQYNLTANQVLNVMVEARTRVNLVMLDACRDNPFKVFGRSVEGGLARMAGPAGTLISFATHPGAIAKDDGPDGHGLYTGSLLKFLSSSPDLEVERIFKLVSNEVFRHSKGSQIPWIEGVMLGDDFCFADCRSSVSVPPSPSQISSAALLDQNVPQPKQATSKAAAPSASVKPAPASPPTKPISLVPPARGPRVPRDPAKILAEGDRPQVSASAPVPAPAPSPEADLESCKKNVLDACERAARAGHALAQATLGWLYTSGEGVTKNLETAAYWYRVAADLGEVGSQKTMAQFYYYGFGVAPDKTLSFYWWRKAAAQGDIEAQRTLGVKYAEGQGVDRDINKAIAWLQKAIDRGDAAAVYEMARVYEQGYHDGLDVRQADDWYRKCSQIEYPACLLREGRLLLLNAGWWNKDKQKGIELIRKAAERGYGPAQLDLGRRYAQGEQVEKDLFQAVHWLRKAQEQGEPFAQGELKKLGY